MGILQQLIGEGRTVRRFVTTPFTQDLGLMAEVQEQWIQHANRSGGQLRDIYFLDTRAEARAIKPKVRVQPILNAQFNGITTPRESVLYILGHSDRQVAEIGGHIGTAASKQVEWWTPQKLVEWLTQGSQRLPLDMLAVKVWSCYSATNGFLAQFRNLMVDAGYRETVFVGYTAITGAMFGKPVPDRPTYTKAAIADDETTVLGRARDHRVVLPKAGPLPKPARKFPSVPPPPPPVSLEEIDAEYGALDLDALAESLAQMDAAELSPSTLGKRLGEVKKV